MTAVLDGVGAAVDWHAAATGHEEWFSDYPHLTPAAQAADTGAAVER